MTQPRFILMGGFLGAGKTSAMLHLAARLHQRGLRVGLVTNDQGVDLVDTARARAAGFDAAQVTGGCFCCQFDSLLAAARSLTGTNPPDAIIAEPVGSCTDILATVGYPLRQLHGTDYRLAPYSVLIDPLRAAGVLGLTPGKHFSERVVYIYLKQLEEAQAVVVNKVDLADAPLRALLRQALAERFPRARVWEVSCRTGEGLDAWFNWLDTDELGQQPAMAVDYDLYAQGEALLGWLNAKATVQLPTEGWSSEGGTSGGGDGNVLLLRLAQRLAERLCAVAADIAHLKMTLAPDTGSDPPELGSVSLSRSDEKPQLTHVLTAPLERGELLINLCAEADPKVLHAAVVEALSTPLLGASFELEVCSAFKPGRPTPTHRLQT